MIDWLLSNKRLIVVLVCVVLLAVLALTVVAAAPDSADSAGHGPQRLILLDHGQSLIVRCRIEVEHPRPVQTTPETVLVSCAPIH